MGKSWDSRGISFSAETWAAIASMLVPGAHLLAFGGTRTFHRIAVAIEDAGFEIRDTIGWVYGGGFPKSHDVSKAIDREAGAEREMIAPYGQGFRSAGSELEGWQRESHKVDKGRTAPATNSARAWQGYGTALKPAWEPVIVARWPLAGTVAQNAQEHGAGALNVDGCRVEWASADDAAAAVGFSISRARGALVQSFSIGKESRGKENTYHPSELQGRFPANIIHDDSDEIADVFGDAKRFFYSAKASKRERDEGLDGFELRIAGAMSGGEETRDDRPTNHPMRANHHPTVKPLALTEYLARMIVPPQHVDSRILVPFAGSGSECIGAIRAGWRHVVGVEQDADYARIARARIAYHSRQFTL